MKYRWSLYLFIIMVVLFAGCASPDGKEMRAPEDADEEIVEMAATPALEEPKSYDDDAAIKEPVVIKKIKENIQEKKSIIDDFADRESSIVKKVKKKKERKESMRKLLKKERKSKIENRKPKSLVEKKPEPEKTGGMGWLWIIWIIILLIIGVFVFFYYYRPKNTLLITSIHDLKKEDRVVYYREDKEIGTWYYHIDETISKHGEKITGEVKSVVITTLGIEYHGMVKYANNRIKDGTYSWYNKKTKKLHEEFTFKKDRRNGPFKTYYPIGRVRFEGNYEMGHLNGVVREYFEEGGVKGTWIYKNKKLREVFQFHKDKRALKEEWKYEEHAQLDGMAKEYYESGNLKAEVPYKNSQIHGTVKEYYDNGILKEVSVYVDGEEKSTKLYDEKGNLVK